MPKLHTKTSCFDRSNRERTTIKKNKWAEPIALDREAGAGGRREQRLGNKLASMLLDTLSLSLSQLQLFLKYIHVRCCRLLSLSNIEFNMIEQG